MAYKLDINDYIFGSHRSHGEILAKGLSAIQKLDDDQLLEIMQNFFEGRILSIVEKGHKGDVKSLALKFLIYGTLAEIFARETGINKGLGGSMHAFFTPFGIYPNNAIVGGSGDIAVGAALYKKVNRKPGIVVANIGDASLGCGPVWEGLTFAAMWRSTRIARSISLRAAWWCLTVRLSKMTKPKLPLICCIRPRIRVPRQN